LESAGARQHASTHCAYQRGVSETRECRRRCLPGPLSFLRGRLYRDAADSGQPRQDRLSGKRGGGRANVPLDEIQYAVDQESEEIVSLHEALEALQAIDPRKSKVVEMRYFGGLSIEDTAEALGISVGTVNREWRLARSWLIREMKRELP
jgi:RNA polymerase sigma factor (sigma-70 family)